jgi:ureidoglycolate hydrolase
MTFEVIASNVSLWGAFRCAAAVRQLALHRNEKHPLGMQGGVEVSLINP